MRPTQGRSKRWHRRQTRRRTTATAGPWQPTPAPPKASASSPKPSCEDSNGAATVMTVADDATNAATATATSTTAPPAETSAISADSLAAASGAAQQASPGRAAASQVLRKVATPRPMTIGQGAFGVTNSDQPLPAFAQTFDPAAEPDKSKRFEAFCQLYPERAKDLYTQVSEVTHVYDQPIIVEAFNSVGCDSDGEFKAEQAIIWLLEHGINSGFAAHSTTSSTSVPPTMPPAVALGRDVTTMPPPNSPANSPRADAKPLVDLTEGGSKEASSDPDLERAIALSLQEQSRIPGSSMGTGQFSQEDQDVSRALEASLLDFNHGSKSKPGEVWTDPLNPHEREREGAWPVGLKNVGQTCWFSAVIQSLFSLAAFRNLVLNFRPAESALTDSDRTNKIREFMLELRRLFALMICSRRKYVDPSRAVEILKGSMNAAAGDNNQQDVSEFTHIVFEWMEEAFKRRKLPGTEDETMEEEAQGPNKNLLLLSSATESVAKEEPSSRPGQSLPEEGNPMAELFYGQLVVEGNSHGNPISRVEAFGQYPLQVNGFSDIHASLENSICGDDFDSTPNSVMERWITKIPPVLVFSLSRFQFNQERRLAEKVHNRLEFPDVLYMDRYLEANKDTTREKREEVRRLNKRREELMTKLNKFTHFGSGEEKVSLSIVLQYVLEYTKGSSASDVATVVGAGPSGPSSHVDRMAPTNADCSKRLLGKHSASDEVHMDSPRHSPKMTPDSFAFCAAAEARHDSEVPMEVDDKEVPAKTVASPHSGPCPRTLADAERNTIQSCLTRLRSEVEEDVKVLQTDIGEIDSKISLMYSESHLRQLEYRLHSVLVHEGSMESGHYWAYVFDHNAKVWLKFNDNTVSEATWQELQKESVGGHYNTSAYSLIYVQSSKLEELAGQGGYPTNFGSECASLDSKLSFLSPDLAEFVRVDNQNFDEERRKWDEDMEKRRLEAAQAAEVDECSDIQVLEEKINYVNTHAKLCWSLSLECIRWAAEEAERLRSGPLLQPALDRARSHYKDCKDTHDRNREVRLDSIVLFLVKNNATDVLLNLALLEQFSLSCLDSDSDFAASLRNQATNKLQLERQHHTAETRQLRDWHQAYHNFRVSAQCFIQGVDFLSQGKNLEALDMFLTSYTLSVEIVESPPKGCYKTLNIRLLVHGLCKSLELVNAKVFTDFSSGNHLEQCLECLTALMVPSVMCLSTRARRNEDDGGSPADLPESRLVIALREQWCALLGVELPDDFKKELVGIIESLLLDPRQYSPPTVKSHKNIDLIDQEDDLKLADRYAQAAAVLQL